MVILIEDGQVSRPLYELLRVRRESHTWHAMRITKQLRIVVTDVARWLKVEDLLTTGNKRRKVLGYSMERVMPVLACRRAAGHITIYLKSTQWIRSWMFLPGRHGSLYMPQWMATLSIIP